MREDFVSYEQAVKLKELGFDWGVPYFYTPDNCYGKPVKWRYESNHNRSKGEISAPSLNIAQKWLREVKKLHIIVVPFMDGGQWLDYKCAVRHEYEWNKRFDYIFSETYEDALFKGLNKALGIEQPPIP